MPHKAKYWEKSADRDLQEIGPYKQVVVRYIGSVYWEDTVCISNFGKISEMTLTLK